MANEDADTMPAAFDLAAARRQFEQEKAPFPPVPETMQAQVRLYAPWVYGTRRAVPALYDLPWFAEEARSQSVADYLLFGHDGHGVNSYAIHYYLVQSTLALFLQIGWGGALMDHEVQSKRLGAAFDWANALIEAAGAAENRAALARPERLIVRVSDFSGVGWEMIDSRRHHLSSSNSPISGPQTLHELLEAIQSL